MPRYLLFVSLLYACWPCAAAADDALYVEYGDCATVLTGGRCVPGDARTLRLWVRADPGAPIVIDDEKRSLEQLQRADVAGGTLIHVRVPDTSDRVRVRASVAQAPAQWSLAIARDDPPPEFAQFRNLYNAGETDAAKALIDRLIADDNYAWRGGAQRRAAIFHHRRGEPDKAREHYALSIELYLAEGRWLDALKAASAYSFLLQQAFRDFAAARDVYAPFADDASAPAEARYFRAYDLGLIAFNSGNPRVALDLLTRAAGQATRMGTTGLWLQRRLDAEELVASQLQRLGRRREAQVYFDAWQARDLGTLSACERAYFLGNVGWSRLLALEAGDAAPDPTSLLESALAIMRERCQAGDVVGGEVNLALAHLHAGRFDRAQAALARARAATETPELRVRFWELDIAARLALEDGQTDVALATLNAMEILAAATLSPDARWRASARRGVVLERMGRTSEALDAYAAAERRFEQDLANVPFYAGRGQFAATRDWVTRRRLQLLLDRDDAQAVADLARAANRRAYLALASGGAARSPDGQRRHDEALAQYESLRQELAQEVGSGWRVPKDELALLEARRAAREQSLRVLLDRTLQAQVSTSSPITTPHAPPPGTLLLALHPLPRGWLSVAVSAERVGIYAPACARKPESDTQLARCLLAPALADFAPTERLVVLPAGALRSLDFHALTLDEGALIDKVAVAYGLDVDAPAGLSLVGGRAVIVSDPTGQLVRSRDEAHAVAAQLTQSGLFALQSIDGAAARLEVVRNGLLQADLFHFAGHASYEGAGAWNSALALARRETMSVSDVLSLARAPRLVVLSACDTARGGQADGDSVGLAQAFVLRGARAALATSRPVRDHDALALTTSFYQYWRQGLDADQALRQAQLALRDADEGADWSAYRLIVR